MPPEDEKRRLIHQWLEKAEHDLMAAERVINGSPSLVDVAVFHWQQAIEKALKGFLTAHDEPFRRSHDLAYLFDQCEKIDPAFVPFRNTALLLIPYATEFRYPGDREAPSAEFISAAMQTAQDVVALVKGRVGA